MNAVIMLGISLALSVGLLGCTPQPKSMFEQQAEAEAANMTLEPDSANPQASQAVTQTTADATFDITGNKHPSTATHTIRSTSQQAIARQPNCDPNVDSCQYLELNILSFSPKQPWLDDIMWQTIARTLAPETPLASQSQSAKNTVTMLLKQIAYSEQPVTSLPMYQRIDTHWHLNPVTEGRVPTAYLIIHSNSQQGASQEPHRYVMLDLQKKLQLTLDDILLPQVSDIDMLIAFDPAKKAWLHEQGVDVRYLEMWPLRLPKVWYLDAEGLHLVYQPGEILPAQTDIADLVMPFTALQDMVKPEYHIYLSESAPNF